MTATQIVLCPLLIATAATGYVDLRTGQIPNRLIAWISGFGVALHLAVHAALLREPGEAWLALLSGAAANICIGILTCALVPLLLFRARAMGGGDVKLLACIGACVGPVLGVQIELYAFVLAAFYIPLRFAFRGQLLSSLTGALAMLANPFRPKEKRLSVPAALSGELRFGPAVFAAVALVAVQRWSVL